MRSCYRMICLLTLCEKYINTEFFLVRIFLYLVRKQQKTTKKTPVVIESGPFIRVWHGVQSLL